MVAYVVAIRERIHDLAELQEYGKLSREARRDRPMKILAAYGRLQVVEGADADGVVILEFPSFEEAKDWYFSPKYQKARLRRFRGADYRFMLVEGVEPA